MIPVTVTFYGDVGFDRSYNHVIDFSSETERSNYFSNKVLKVIQNCAYNKPINTIQLKCPYTDALKFTYCKFVMGSNPNKQKTIYAWVDDVILITDQVDSEQIIKSERAVKLTALFSCKYGVRRFRENSHPQG